MPQPQRGWVRPAITPEPPKVSASSAPTHRARNIAIVVPVVVAVLLLLNNHFIIVSRNRSLVVLHKTPSTTDGIFIGEANWGLVSLHPRC